MLVADDECHELRKRIQAWRVAHEGDLYWLQHGVLHQCRAGAGKAEEAAEVYATNLELLRRRVDAKLLATIIKDFLELRAAKVDVSGAPSQMRRFVGQSRGHLER